MRNLCVVGFLSGFLCSVFSIQLMGRNISDNSWSKVKRIISCWSTNSHWTLSDHPQMELKNVKCGHSSCDKPYPHTNYIWQTKNKSDCHGIDIRDFDSNQMKRILGFNNILVVGDSVTDRFVTGVRNALSDGDPSISCPHCNFCTGHDSDSNVIFSGENYSFSLINVRNDYVRVTSSFLFDLPEKVNIDLRDWLHPLEAYNISILILNRGLHIEANWRVIRDLHMTFTYLVKNYPNLFIIYRNTPPGVMKHHLYFDSPPLTEPQDRTIMPYLWGILHDQNELIRKMIEEEFLSILYLDVESPSQYLVHRHDDEVHVCQWGDAPHKIWIHLLYNSLLLIDEVSKANEKEEDKCD